MAMAKQGYKTLNTGSTTVKINVNSDGNIAQETDTVEGTKNFKVTGVNVDNGLDENTEVVQAFVNYFAGGTQDSLTSTMTAKWEV